MTIKIEQEAIIQVLEARTSLPCHPHRPRKPPSTSGLSRSPVEPPCLEPYVAVDRSPADDDHCPDLQSLDSDSDEDCISLSSCGSASSYGGRSAERRVSFATPLVTSVKTRPRTKDCEKGLLFYTQSETDRFRQVYREERQSSSSDCVQTDSLKDRPTFESPGRRRISRVVVEHKDNLDTFYDFDGISSYPAQGGASINDVFFDNDSFWSGSITWY